MGDGHLRPLRFFSDPDPAASSLQMTTRRNVFLYALYNYLNDPKAANNKKKVQRAAKTFGQDCNVIPEFTRQVEFVLPLLVKNDEYYWLRLLCFIGRMSPSYAMFKDISPFAGKIIARIRFDQSITYVGRIDTHSLPEVDRLWSADSLPEDIARRISSQVIVLPRDTVISLYDVG